MIATPFLEAWFAIMDSDAPERVLDRISDDFVMSILFSRGESEAAEFVGDRAGLVAYLEQREKSVLVHEVTHGARWLTSSWSWAARPATARSRRRSTPRL